jgi:hypothetical protein
MVFDPTTAKPVQATGGFDISTASPAQVQQPDFTGAAVIEPIKAIGSAAGRAVAGGVAGIFQALNPFAEEGAGAETVREFQQGAFQPTTEAGKQGLEALGGLVQKGIDIANFPISGIAGLVELVSGQGLDQAAETIKSIQEKGLSTTAGQRVFEETGSPLAATIAEVAPTAALEVIGLKGAGAATRATTQAAAQVPAVARQAVAATGQAISQASEALAPTARAIFNFQSPTKQRIAKLIEEGSTDVETARFRLAPGQPKPEQPTRLQEFLDVGGPRVQADTSAVNAINQGFDEGVIAAIKGAPPTDKVKMLKMANVMERGKKNKLFAQSNRPTDIAGNTLMKRFKIVVKANKSAGKELDSVAKSLKGQTVDTTPAVNQFIDDLDSMGIAFTDDLQPIFKGSDIEGGSAEALKAQSIIKTTINRMRDTRAPDAFDTHRLKRFIDSQVTFGKTTAGLPGGSERILKNLRRNIDGILDNQFPEYDRVNTVFSETIGAIDNLQDVAGKKMDLSGPNAEKATGTLLKRLMGNEQSRIRLLDAVNDIESAAKKFETDPTKIRGPGGVPEDLLTQILFADELDRVFGPVARTSFQGQIDQALKQGVGAVTTREGAIDVALKAAGKVAERARGINEAGAFKAIKELLKDQK